MALGEVTGYTEAELAELRDQHESNPLYRDHEIPFEVAYCLCRIGKQPEDYDGPQRYCSRRASKLKPEEWAERYEEPYEAKDERAYCHTCAFHGRTIDGDVSGMEEVRLHAAIKHGAYATDKHLQMDFNDAEQTVYDSIVGTWPDIYDWPARDEDPARYLILDKVATNVVRTERCEDYLDDDGEVHLDPVFDDQGVVMGHREIENPLSREYRLLVGEVNDMLKELGLTPKEQAKQGTRQQSADALGAITQVVSEAVVGSDGDYDPSEWEDDSDDS
jgi:hypothetical protein